MVPLLLLAPACPKKARAGVGVPSGEKSPARTEPVKTEPAARPEADPPPQQPPRLLSDPKTGDSTADVEALLHEVERILGILAGRSLADAEQRERDAGATFVAQSRRALEAGDPGRAAVLAEKARVLMENLERSTRR